MLHRSLPRVQGAHPPSPRGSPPPTAPKTKARHPASSPLTQTTSPPPPELVLGGEFPSVGGGGGGVSHKIQQLLNTLKRPKKTKRPIEQYYREEEDSKYRVRGVGGRICKYSV